MSMECPPSTEVCLLISAACVRTHVLIVGSPHSQWAISSPEVEVLIKRAHFPRRQAMGTCLRVDINLDISQAISAKLQDRAKRDRLRNDIFTTVPTVCTGSIQIYNTLYS